MRVCLSSGLARRIARVELASGCCCHAYGWWLLQQSLASYCKLIGYQASHYPFLPPEPLGPLLLLSISLFLLPFSSLSRSLLAFSVCLFRPSMQQKQQKQQSTHSLTMHTLYPFAFLPLPLSLVTNKPNGQPQWKDASFDSLFKFHFLLFHSPIPNSTFIDRTSLHWRPLQNKQTKKQLTTYPSQVKCKISLSLSLTRSFCLSVRSSASSGQKLCKT